MTTTKTRWLTRQETAQRAGVTLRTVDRWLAQGLLTRHVSAARSVHIDAVELDALLAPVPDPARSA